MLPKVFSIDIKACSRQIKTNPAKTAIADRRLIFRSWTLFSRFSLNTYLLCPSVDPTNCECLPSVSEQVLHAAPDSNGSYVILLLIKCFSPSFKCYPSLLCVLRTEAQLRFYRKTAVIFNDVYLTIAQMESPLLSSLDWSFFMIYNKCTRRCAVDLYLTQLKYENLFTVYKKVDLIVTTPNTLKCYEQD